VVNPNGLAFFSGQAVSSNDAMTEVAPLADQSLARLKTALAGAQVEAADVVRVTCFLSSLGDGLKVRQQMAAAFPKASHSMVQLLRGHSRGLVECEAVGRLKAAPAEALVFLNPSGLEPSPNYSQVALVGPGKLVLSGTQMAFHGEEQDVRLAFDRLKKVVEQAGAKLGNVAMSSVYPLSQAVADKVRKVRFEFYDPKRPPASTMLIFEGLPSMDATFAVDVIAVM
jgi:enamine deaminase RidA (YjgF/YER057c/UK114 family)